MDVAEWIVVVAAVVLVLVTVVWFVTTRAHPEVAAGQTDDPTDDVARRPAGPAAEPMSSRRPGGRTPVEPSAGELGPDSGRHVTDEPPA